MHITHLSESCKKQEKRIRSFRSDSATLCLVSCIAPKMYGLCRPNHATECDGSAKGERKNMRQFGFKLRRLLFTLQKVCDARCIVHKCESSWLAVGNDSSDLFMENSYTQMRMYYMVSFVVNSHAHNRCTSTHIYHPLCICMLFN